MTDYSDTDQTCLLDGTMYYPSYFTNGLRIPCAAPRVRGLCDRHYRIARRNGDLAEMALPDSRIGNTGSGRKRVLYSGHCQTCKCKPE